MAGRPPAGTPDIGTNLKALSGVAVESAAVDERNTTVNDLWRDWGLLVAVMSPVLLALAWLVCVAPVR